MTHWAWRLLFFTFPLFSRSKILTRDECFWGRIYLENGIAPIQYFKGSYGGPVLDQETPFIYPSENTDGCKPYHENQVKDIRGKTLIVERGTCPFDLKTQHAQDAGALAVIVVSQSDDVMAPFGNIDDQFNLVIATVMIRHSAGVYLAETLKLHPDIKGRIIPFVCHRENKKSTCQATTKIEMEYAASSLVKGGEIKGVGEYLTARYGGLMPTTTTAIVNAPDFFGCDEETGEENTTEFNDKVVILNVQPSCSNPTLGRVTRAHKRGALGIVLVLPSFNLQRHSVAEDYLGYNITVGVVSVTRDTGERLRGLTEGHITFQPNNQVYENWREIQLLRDLREWPSTRPERESLLRSLLHQHSTNNDRVYLIKQAFIDISGGSVEALDAIVANSQHVKEEL